MSISPLNAMESSLRFKPRGSACAPLALASTARRIGVIAAGHSGDTSQNCVRATSRLSATMKRRCSIDYAKTSRHRNIKRSVQGKGLFGAPILHSVSLRLSAAHSARPRQRSRAPSSLLFGSAPILLTCNNAIHALWYNCGHGVERYRFRYLLGMMIPTRRMRTRSRVDRSHARELFFWEHP